MARLPRIACFHGGGSNARIYSVQCSRLQKLLANDFEFVYFEAPFERNAGPDVWTAFEDYAPFKTWLKTDESGERSDGSGYDALGKDGVERVWKLMEAEGAAGEWVGAMGFSQGTRVVGGLLLDQQRRSIADVPGNFDLKFGVLCMGSGAPMKSEISHAMNHDRIRNGSGSAIESDIDLVSIPTLHLHGLQDGNLGNGRKQMAMCYDPKKTTLYEIDYHHAMPWVSAEILQLAELIKRVHKNTQIKAI